MAFTPNPERIQLAPLRLDNVDCEPSSNFAMQRQHSVSSTDSDTSSGYCHSSSGSPDRSPTFGRTSTRGQWRFHPYAKSPRNKTQVITIQCPSCLERGVDIAVEPGKACPSCNTPCRELTPEEKEKAGRQKRNDRIIFSKLMFNLPGVEKPSTPPTKEQTEAGNRLDHTTLIGLAQHQLVTLIPDLPTKARIGNGRKKMGWKALNQNNVSADVPIPLTVNKHEIFISGPQVLGDSDDIIRDLRDNAARRQQNAAMLLASNPSFEECLRYIELVASSNDAEHIEASRRTRGTDDFHLPIGQATSP
ncbi:hypothetical protein ACEQ8H_001544 [Pleosporales sp. CAS-2024a]